MREKLHSDWMVSTETPSLVELAVLFHNARKVEVVAILAHATTSLPQQYRASFAPPALTIN